MRGLTDIREASGRYGVLHIGGRRQRTVTANTDGANMGACATRVEATLKRVRRFSGITVTVESAAAEQAKSARPLLVNLLLAGASMSCCCR